MVDVDIGGSGHRTGRAADVAIAIQSEAGSRRHICVGRKFGSVVYKGARTDMKAPCPGKEIYTGLDGTEIEFRIVIDVIDGEGPVVVEEVRPTTSDTAPEFTSIAVQPGNSNIVLAANTNSFGTAGLFRSTDGGQTWSHVVSTGGYSGVTAVMFDVQNPSIAYAGVGGIQATAPIAKEA